MKFFYETIRHEKLHCMLGNTLDFPAHIHDSVEFVYLLSGSAKVLYEGEEYLLKENDAFIVFPQKIHYYYQSENVRVINTIVPTDYLLEFGSLFRTKILLTPHIQNAPSFCRALLLEAEKSQNLSFKKGAIEAAFSLLIENAEFSDKKSSDPTTLQKVLNYCENNFTENITLDDVAKALFISKSYISHIFSDKIKMGFRYYLNSLRLSLAANYLKEGKLTVTEISYNCGFENIRSFNRAFKKQFNITPSSYRKDFHKF